MPLAFNIAAASVLMWLLFRLLEPYAVRRWRAALPVLLILLLAPIVPVVFCGMEHLLQALLVVAFVSAAAAALADPRADAELPESPAGGARPRTRPGLAVPILGLLVTMIRFEDAFLVAVVCVLFVLRRRWLPAVLLGLAAALPIAVHGLIAVRHGWYLLPNSVLLKGNAPDLASFSGVLELLGRTAFREIGRNPHLVIWLGLAVTGLLALHGRRRVIWQGSSVLALVFIVALLLHAQFARVGHFFRYELYLGVLAGFALAAGFGRDLPERVWRSLMRGPWPRSLAYGALVIWVLLSLGSRALGAHLLVPRAARNIYHQHCQLGSFLGRYYTGQGIAANDIGAINYFADIDCFDVWGLVTKEVIDLKREGRYSIRMMREFARRRGVQVAAIYDSWFQPIQELRAHWELIGIWTIPDNVICGSPTVSFYAVDPLAGRTLAENLAAFNTGLPDGIQAQVFRDVGGRGEASP